MRRSNKSWGPKLLGVSCVWIAAACGSSGDGGSAAEVVPPSAELVVDVTFANELTRTVTYSLHVWALRPKEGATVTCNQLIGAEADPYQFDLIRLADHATTELGDAISVENVEVGAAFVYVEGVNFAGEAEIAGCTETTLEEPSTSVAVTLKTAGVFDCEAADTEDGAACDDGEFCTVGETCDGGTCQGGSQRNCSALADECTAAACSETLGCEVTPVADDTPCDDGLYCTGNDSCQEGLCVGSALNCEALAGPCREATGCDETSGSCTFTNINQGLECDDELHCTVDSVCNLGACVGTARDCSLEVGDDCNVAACSESEGGCQTTPASSLTICDDSANECTELSGYCDGLGACDATPVMDGDLCNEDLGQCVAGECQTN